MKARRARETNGGYAQNAPSFILGESDIDVRFPEGVALVLAALVVGGCRPHPVAQPKTAAIRQEEHRQWMLSPPIAVSLPDEAVVHVVSRGVGCSGTLITNSLVLTAHHCVVERGPEGEILDKDLPASALEVELGGDYLPWGTVKVQALVAPPCGHQGGHGDIAILVLARKLVGLATMEARLTGLPRLGEPIDAVGFGRCPMSTDGIHRIRREGGAIEKVGFGSMFAATSICPGDSGGPARSQTTGEVVGVVSAGVMDDDDQTRDPTTFTRLDVWRSLFVNAQLIVDGSSPAEVPPVEGCSPL